MLRKCLIRSITTFCLAVISVGLLSCQSNSAEVAPIATIPVQGDLPAVPGASSPTLAPASLATVAMPATAVNPEVASGATATANVLAPEPSATHAIPGLIGPANFPANVNPLTGEVVTDPAVLARRPLAIKVSNYPPVVRPQAGLNDADLVFEHYAEGSVTRFTAIYYSRDAARVGSIRSGRLIDMEIPQMYDAAFAYSGSSGPVQLLIRNSNFFGRVISPDFGHGGFVRITDPNNPDKPFEHTLFTDTGTLRSILAERGENRPPTFASNMAFTVQPPAGGAPASALEVGYGGTTAFWQFNDGTGRYTRWTDGVPHVDANSGSQLNFKNVVLIGAHHEDTDIVEDMVGGGHFSIQIQVWGEGPVSIFRDGQRYDGHWRRSDPGQMLTFYDLTGNILPLAPGNTFIQLVPLGFTGLTVTP